MILWDVSNGRGGKFIFRPKGGKYSWRERRSVKAGIVKAVKRLMTELMNATPVASGVLKGSWGVSVDGNELRGPVPQTRHGRGFHRGGSTYRVTGAQKLNKQYELGQMIEVWNDAEYANAIAEGTWFNDGSYAKDWGKSQKFGAAIEAAMSNFDVQFEESRLP